LSESEKSWVHKLFFNAYFEDALAKYRAQTGLGESYAILYALNEYWFQIGLTLSTAERVERTFSRIYFSIGRIVNEFPKD